MTDWQVSISNMEGNVLYTKQYDMKHGIDLEIEHFKSGVYVVMCRDFAGQMIFAKRVVKI